ncbi:Uncharacterized protein LOK49_LG13G02233 [Camellia lanceoleosa]|uniref:Uncharacterized protein n=1 Tax=Camellia lanceoleosa TaxID=1840588 RepID=A0ACC0FIA4_9ERIC|nr:Uncharacterized protein LOK49_LG13G02233 [Camellia lanceoleosa]
MLGEVDPTVQPSDIRLTMVHLWVHVCNLPLILMNKEVGQIVGNAIGQFLDMDFEDGGIAWGRTMRIRVAIDVRKPLRRGMKLSLSSADPIWVDFKYERLSIFCYFCGLLGHTDRDCDAKLSSAEGSRIDVMQYGAWKENEGPLPSIPKPGALADVVPAQHRDRDVHVGQSLFPVIDGVCPETAVNMATNSGIPVSPPSPTNFEFLHGRRSLLTNWAHSPLTDVGLQGAQPTQIEPVPVAKSSPIVPTVLMEIEARPLGVTVLGKKKWKRVARQHMESTTVHSPDTRNKRVLEEVAACGVPQGDKASEQHIGKRLCMLGEAHLADMGFVGPIFTWSNNRDGNDLVRERLDRGLANDAWQSLFPHAKVYTMACTSSGHLPICVDIYRAKEQRHSTASGHRICAELGLYYFTCKLFFAPMGTFCFWVCQKTVEGENRATTAVAYSKLQFSNRCRNTE